MCAHIGMNEETRYKTKETKQTTKQKITYINNAIKRISKSYEKSNHYRLLLPSIDVALTRTNKHYLRWIRYAGGEWGKNTKTQSKSGQ